MKNIIIAVCLISLLVLVGCAKEASKSNTTKQEEQGKLITVVEQSVEIQKPTAPPAVPSHQTVQQANTSQTQQAENTQTQNTETQQSQANTSTSNQLVSEKIKILILNFRGNPPELEAKAGTTIIWENGDDYGHKIGIFHVIEGPILRKGETWSYIFTEPGNYTWMSMSHPKTNGLIIVK